METAKLKKFAQFARRSLIEQVSAKLNLALAEGSAARREQPQAIAELEKQLREYEREQVVERIAYTWFNRFCALRFMDVNRYTRIGVISPAEGQFQPEILAEAKMGHIDEEMVPEKIRQQIFALLAGTVPSRDPQAEAYRLLVVAACNDFHRVMPYLFERIADFTELLMPDDLLSENSILAYTREAMTSDVCGAGSNQLSVISNQQENTDACLLKADSSAAKGGIEVIGWLYQFYISEKKDKVFDDLKKNKKITPENIPAATQLFTPYWIVRYLVENSLGRLWMLNRPNSKLIEQMEYYIRPVSSNQLSVISNQEEGSDGCTLTANYLRPEEIKICDPACGSGHILTYAFDILYAIYEEEGYEPSEIPEKILTHNLYGIEIDERAGELAAFALTMKARARQRRFFRKPIQPNICVLRNIHFEENELEEYMDFIGRDLFTAPLQTTLQQFEEADNFGSLIRPAVTDVAAMLQILEAKSVSGQLFLGPTYQKVLQALQQADYLSPKFHVVIANPPYMGGKGMNPRLGAWVKENYPDSKSDLFTMFIERNLDLAQKHGAVGMITMQSWMFLSSFEKLREKLLDNATILSMAHLGARGFDSIGGEVVSTTAFVLGHAKYPEHKGAYLRLIDGKSEAEKKAAILNAIKNPNCGWFYRASAADFKKIPGSPIAYWASQAIRKAFVLGTPLKEVIKPKQGTSTGDDETYVRHWYEVNYLGIGFSVSDLKMSQNSRFRYFPLDKGGDNRRWYGNNEKILRFDPPAFERLSCLGNNLPSRDLYFLPGLTWSKIASGRLGVRKDNEGFIFSSVGLKGFPDLSEMDESLGFMNSKVAQSLISTISSSLSIVSGDIEKIPFIKLKDSNCSIIRIAVKNAKKDWDSFETSWDFTYLPLLNLDYRQPNLKATYAQLRAQWQEITLEMQRLEEENNRIFINAYGLQEELTPEVPLSEITLTCNPHYRYSNSKNAEELETLLLADIMKEFISYAVGCMFGRYALEKPGLILANQGDTIEEYLRQIPEPIFPADNDNVIPILDGDWFTDDITERFRKFLRITFGEEHYEENLKFIEVALGKEIRKYFLKDFYNDHLRRYKKRPIYWLFSSPKGSFNALIYMHRYRPDTASVVLNGYLREFRIKLLSRKSQLEAVSISASASPGEKTKALKEIESLRKMIEELESYEREVLYPLATEQIAIDLDGGVKVNYQKFGPALKKIPGLDTKEE